MLTKLLEGLQEQVWPGSPGAITKRTTQTGLAGNYDFSTIRKLGNQEASGPLLVPGSHDLSCETESGNHCLHWWFRNIPPGPTFRGQEADSIIVASRARVFC